jgi:hypothetical protein
MSVIALNTAYGNMSVEDIDYGLMLFSKEYYRKLMDIYKLKAEELARSIFTKYSDWMQAQGATVKEGPMLSGD